MFIALLHTYKVFVQFQLTYFNNWQISNNTKQHVLLFYFGTN